MRQRQMRGIAIATAVAAALAVAGCGGNQSFIKSYNEAAAPLQALGSGTSATGPGAAKSLDGMADKLALVRDRLGKLEAPDGAQDELDRLLRSLDAGEKDVRAVAAAVKSGDPDKAAKATKVFADQAVEMGDAEQALKTAVNG